METRDEIVASVEANAAEGVALCRGLVRINTVNPYSGEGNESNEAEGQGFLKQALERMGGECVLFDCPDDVYERTGVHGPEGRQFRGRPNLVAEFVLGDGGRTIIINGHMDTVGIADMTIDPFGAELKDGKIFGRGSCDCKGGLAAAVLALQALLGLHRPVNGRVLFESVIDEECNGSGAGTLACCERGYRGDAAMVIDGSAAQVSIACMGVLTAEVAVTGRGGHAASRDVVSAIDKAVVVKEALDQVKRTREARCSQATLNLGVFQAGVLPAVVPSTARLAFNMQYEMSELREAERMGLGPCGALARQELERAVRDRCERDDWLRDHPPSFDWIKDLTPFETDPGVAVVRETQRAYRDVTGDGIEATRMSAWCDAAWLGRLGRMPVLSHGTSRPGRAHSPDEWVKVEDVLRTAKVFALSMYRQMTD